ncbi:MAG TPA: hypothetical protein VGN80_00345 [Devosiaceae bacterium]|jgi:hypothetical protein|nr:hypothetical protein [Devosiaceae bacterium]
MNAERDPSVARWRSPLVFPLKALAAVSSSAVFGLVAALAFEQWSLGVAVGLGFLFGTAFIAGTGYRILVALWQRQLRYAPTSWSGATATSAMASAAGFVALVLAGHAGAPLLLGFALAINIAYFCVKLGCLLAGCCGSREGGVERGFDLRHLEIGWTLLILVLAAITGVLQPAVGASLGVLGHVLLRLFSRARRGRFSLGWPPMRQPGAELVPLYLVLTLTLVSHF